MAGKVLQVSTDIDAKDPSKVTLFPDISRTRVFLYQRRILLLNTSAPLRQSMRRSSEDDND